jgi:hypothetical protein
MSLRYSECGSHVGIGFQTRKDGRMSWLEQEALVRIADSLAKNGVLRVVLREVDMRFVPIRLAQR